LVKPTPMPTHLYWPLTSDARLFCKKKQVNLKNKAKIGNSTEKQAQNAFPGKFNKTKNQKKIT